MKKRLSGLAVVLICAALLLVMTACGDGGLTTQGLVLAGIVDGGVFTSAQTNEQSSPRASLAGSAVKESELVGLPVSEMDSFELLSSRDYKNGRAWIKYETDEGVFLGSIDKEGNEIVHIDAREIDEYDDYDEEYAYLHSATFELIVIDKSGNQLYSVMDLWGDSILAYGGGYTLCTHHEASFDTSYDVYEIYYPSGEVKQIDIGGKFGAATYCGESVFGISLRQTWDWTVTFYCAESSSWIVSPDEFFCGSTDVRYEDGLICFAVGYADPDRDGYRSILYIADLNGWHEEHLDFGWNWNDYGAGYHDGTILLYEIFDDTYYSYDLTTKEWFVLNERYASRLVEGDFKDRSGAYSKETGFINDRVPLLMKGDDGKNYIALFKKDLEPVAEPMTYSTYLGFDGFRLVLRQNGDVTVYDENMNKLYTAADIGVRQISSFSDGAAMVDTGKYIDRDGNLLFDDIRLAEQTTELTLRYDNGDNITIVTDVIYIDIG